MSSGDYKQKSLEFVQNLWHVYIMFPSTKDEIGKVVQCLSPNAIVIGTGKHEFYENRAKFLQSLDRDLAESEEILFDICDEWYESTLIGDHFYLVYGFIWIKEKYTPDKSVFVDMYTRFSILLEYCEDNFIIHHIHQSIPYMYQQDGEYYPKTFVDEAEEAIRKVKLLEKQVEVDPMTGLYNRIYTEAYINKYLKNSSNAVFFVTDLDDFKQVNDTLGHLQGDQVICHYAKLMREIFPSNSIVGRVGGDEFIIFVPNTTIAQAEQLAKKLIHRHNQYLLQFGLDLSCSIGMIKPQKYAQFTELYHNADKALYYAKQQGKHCFSWYDKKDSNFN